MCKTMQLRYASNIAVIGDSCNVLVKVYGISTSTLTMETYYREHRAQQPSPARILWAHFGCLDA